MSARRQRLGAWIIRRHPRAFLRAYGDDMLETFRARCGPGARPAFVLRELLALSASVATEWLRYGRLAFSHAGREARHAGRRLAGTPAFTCSAVGILALSLGLLIGVFTLVHRIVLRPLPYPEADRLVALDHAAPGVGLAGDVGMSLGTYREYAALPSVAATAIYYVNEATVDIDGEATRAEFMGATPSLSAVLGFAPASGRWFVEEEGREGAARRVVLTDAYWRSAFGMRPDVLGATMRIGGEPHEIIGVLAPGLQFPHPRVAFVIPLPMPASITRAAGFNYSGIARLAPGATAEGARAEQNAVIADLPARFPQDTNRDLLRSSGLTSLLEPYQARLVGDTAATLWLLLLAAAAVVCMATANLANLFLVRGRLRAREGRLRRAIGAGPWSLAAFSLAEPLIVALAGGALGLALAYAGLRVLAGMSTVQLPRLHEVHLDPAVIALAVLASLLTGIVLGALPALQARTPGNLGPDAQRVATADGRSVRLRFALVTVQLALAVMVVTAAGLLARSFANLSRVDPGFVSDQRLVFEIGLPRTEFTTRESAATWHAQTIARLAEQHGLVSVAATTRLPLDGDGQGDPLQVEGATQPSSVVVRFRRVSDDYFKTIGIPIVAGRGFDRRDAGADVAVVDHTLASLYFPGADPVGRRVRPASDDDPWLTIVGVVGDTATFSLDESERVGKLYVPMQGAMRSDVGSGHEMAYVVRTADSPLAAVPAIRAIVRERHPGVPMARVGALSEIVARSRAGLVLVLTLVGAAGVVAVLLGVVGVYAVVAYGVSERRTEMAVRLAIGATPGSLIAMVLRQGAPAIVLGVIAGTAGAALSTSMLRAMLFGVDGVDLPVAVAAPAALLALAFMSTWLPARRASRTSPAMALRG